MKTGLKLMTGVLVVALLIGAVWYYSGLQTPTKIQENVTEVEQETKPEPITNTISIGTVGRDATKFIKRFQPTADHIAAKLSDEENKYKGKVIIAKTVDDMIDLLKEQKLDLYMESPFTTAFVAEKSGAVPFLRRWKQGVAEYHTVFFVKKESNINALDDFIGKTIAFEAPESTSGYLLPKSYLLQKGFKVVPKGPNVSSAGENSPTITYVFSGEDENTALWVVEGKADIGAFSNIDFEGEETPEALKNQLKVIDRTIDVPRHVVTHRSELDPVRVERIEQILMDMDKDPEGIEILKNFKNTKKYDEIPDKEELFSTINEMLRLSER